MRCRCDLRIECTSSTVPYRTRVLGDWKCEYCGHGTVPRLGAFRRFLFFFDGLRIASPGGRRRSYFAVFRVLRSVDNFCLYSILDLFALYCEEYYVTLLKCKCITLVTIRN